MIFYISPTSGIDCGDPSGKLKEYMEFLGGKPTTTTYQTKVKIVCGSNMKFDDLSTSQTIECQADGTWTLVTRECSTSTNYYLTR